MTTRDRLRLLALAAIAGLALPCAATALNAGGGGRGETAVALTLSNHRFEPADIAVPAGETVTIVLTNRDGATEEFDSDDLGVEQDVTPHGRVTFTVGPLKPGAYDFMGELHPTTALGRLVASGGR